MPCSRTTNAPSPMYPSRAQRKDCMSFSRRDGISSRFCCWRRLRSRRPAVLYCTTGDGAGGFLRVVLRAANKNRTIAGGQSLLDSSASRAGERGGPLSRILCFISWRGGKEGPRQGSLYAVAGNTRFVSCSQIIPLQSKKEEHPQVFLFLIHQTICAALRFLLLRTITMVVTATVVTTAPAMISHTKSQF